MTYPDAYDPFLRGSHPVGVVTHEWTDESRARTLPVEVWFPAVSAHSGQDLDPEYQDRFQSMPMAPTTQQAAVRDAAPVEEAHPLVVFSHGFGGERRQTTHLCTHLASHGYVVASMDHVGNTTADMLAQSMATQTGGQLTADPAKALIGFAEDRPADAIFVIDQMVAGQGGVSVDSAQVGMTGHSFGGWTTLQTTGQDSRIRAALPLAPAGGRTAMTFADAEEDLFSSTLQLDWKREVPTLFLVADHDTLLPLDGMKELIERTPEPKKGLVLINSDHFHFCDGVEQTHDLFKQMGPLISPSGGESTSDAQALFSAMKPSSELCSGEKAMTWIQGLGLAHMDAHVRGSKAACELMSGDLVALMKDREIEIEVIA